jgi:hypothetical protein
LETDIIHPSLLSYDYEIQKEFEHNGISIIMATRLEKLPYIKDNVLRLVFGDDFSHSMDLYTHNIFEALNALERHGFIYRSVLVSLAADNSDVVFNYYELDCKINNKSKYKNKLFCNDIKLLTNELGLKHGRDDNRFYDQYFAIAPSDMRINVSTVYRLKYSVTNPNNYKVNKAISRRKESNARVIEWMARIRPAGNLSQK